MKRFLGIMFCCFVLTSCTSRLIYPYLDWLIAWKMDSYFTLNVEQERWLSKQLEHLLLWHRDQEIPTYTQNIHFILRDVNRKLNNKEIGQHLTEIDESIVRVTTKLVPMAAGLTVRLDEHQIKPFLTNRQRHLQERISQWRTLSESKDYGVVEKKLKERLKRWIGPLSPQQEKLVKQWAQWRVYSFPIWLEFQKDVLATLEVSYKNKKEKRVMTQSEVEKKLNTLLFEKGSKFGLYRQSFHTFFTPWIAQLDGSLTKKQRAVLTRRLAGLKSEFQLLTMR